MRAPALLPAALLSMALAGCLTSPAGLDPASAPPAAVPVPAVEAPGAVVEVLEGAVRVVWTGVAVPAGTVPATDPRWPIPRFDQELARHELTLPPEVTSAAGLLAFEGLDGALGYGLVNATGALWCGSLPRGTEQPCAAALAGRRAGAEPWAVRILGNPLSAQAAPVPYTMTFTFSAAPLPRLGPPAPHGEAAPLRFAERVVVHDATFANEPSLAVTPQGTVWIAALGMPYGAWRSADGQAFELVEVTDVPYCDAGAVDRIPPLEGVRDALGMRRLTHFGCGDVDIATAGEDTVVFSAHWGNEAIVASHDGGATWTTTLLGAGADAHTDRQWVVTDGPDTIWHAFTSVMTNRIVVTQSVDGGRTFPVASSVPFLRACVSTLARAPDGTLYVGSCDLLGGPGVAVSTDRGLTWTWRSAGRPGPLAFILVQVTTDAAGNVYLIWTDPPEEGKGQQVGWAASRDQGRTWTPPRPVFEAPGTYVFPWATGGADGRLAVAAYGTRLEGPAAQAIADWYPVVALTEDAFAEDPAFHAAAATAEPIQVGPVCLGGNTCAHARNLGDYFQVQADGQGTLHMAYARADPADGLRPTIAYVRQAGGPTLGGPSVDKHGGT